MTTTNAAQNGRKLIVLVEDDEVMVNLLTRALEKSNYLVEVARDGEQGLVLIRDRKPDLVLLDIILPGLGGFGVLEALYKEKLVTQIPIIIISNSGQPVEIERAIKLGAQDYLIKVNFDPNELMGKIDRALRQAEEGTIRAPSLDEAHGNSHHGHILLVEDDKFLAELLARKFRQQGYEIFLALSAEDARQALEAQETVHMILLDLVLPGVDGFTFLSELKAHPQWSKIPVIILSNLGQQEEIKKGMELGAEDYIVKANASTEEIFKKVEAVIEAKYKAES